MAPSLTLLVPLCLLMVGYVVCKVNVKYILQVNDIKQYKKVLKTHTNVLTVYSKDDKSVLSLLKWVDDLAKEVKGKGTVVYINCGENKDAKKLCKKYSANPKPKLLKHYKDGSFSKDYDRKETYKSMLNFMLDPTGDAPWEEDPAALNVVQINTEKELIKLRRKEKGPLLIMFYAPWCGYCKKLKPDYAAAANEMKGKAVLAGMDVDKPDAFNVRYQFNITGFPTIVYFEKGEEKYRYSGKYDKQGIIDWLEDPQPETKEEKKGEEASWSTEAPEVTHLTDETFPEALEDNPSMIVMFYAPWCGHCKTMKPEYVEAAKQMKEDEISGTLAAMDCTKETKTCKKYDVSGYPTVKYFENGEFKFKLNVRTKDKVIEFMKNPEAPPPPPKEDLPWHEVSGPEILHLEDATFKDELKKKKHVLVMFYAPWCGHCKNAKPEIEKAASEFKDDRKIWFAGVDCTVQTKVCEKYEVRGYPTFRYFLYGKKDFSYDGGRTSDGFISFMNNPSEKPASPTPPQEEEWKDTLSAVVHLGDDDFDEFVKTKPSVLVMFYAPWCGHCKSMKPGYVEAANDLVGEDHVLAAVDCTKHRETASKYDISGYPTLKYFRDGSASEYQGGRSKADITLFLTGKAQQAKEKTQEPKVPTWADENNDVLHLDSTNFHALIKQESSVLVMFYAPWCGHCKRMKPAYGDAAKIVNVEKQVAGKLAAVDCTASGPICAEFGVRGYPTVIYFKNGAKDMEYDGGRATSDLVNFMKNPAPAPPKPVEVRWSDEKNDVGHLTDQTFEDYIVKEKSVLVMFYAPWCGHCKKMKPAFAEAAKIVNNNKNILGKLAAVDCTADEATGAKYEIKGYPTLKYFKDGKEIMKYQGARTTDALVDFMKKPENGGDASAKPKAPEWKETPSEVHHLTDETFDAFVKDKEVLVMFYAPWCGHCSSMKPAYMETAKKLKDDNFPGVLAAVEATKERTIAQREGTKGYPTLKYYSNGKFVESFEEMRTVENMVSFMNRMLQDKPAAELDSDRFEDIPSSVIHLTAENFESHLASVPNAIVFFHVKACKLCLTIRNEMLKAAARLNQLTAYGIAALNCDTYGELCQQQDALVFPTLNFYQHGSFVEAYSSAMTSEGFVAYLQLKEKEEL